MQIMKPLQLGLSVFYHLIAIDKTRKSLELELII